MTKQLNYDLKLFKLLKFDRIKFYNFLVMFIYCYYMQNLETISLARLGFDNVFIWKMLKKTILVGVQLQIIHRNSLTIQFISTKYRFYNFFLQLKF